jgi:Cytochrome c554 and c-prime
MTPKPTRNPPRLSPIILAGIVVTVLFAACLGVYLASSVDTTDQRASREVAPPPKGLLPLDAAIVSQLVGGKACQECHPGESALHSLSGHARTLRRRPATAIASWINARSFKDQEYPEAIWTYSVTERGRLEVERDERGQSDCYSLDYALGSGGNGVTFVSLDRSKINSAHLTGVEHRLSYFANGHRMDITPGQSKEDAAALKIKVMPQGRPLDQEELVKCFDCHATVTSTKGSGQFDPETMVPNVSCERCHGPGHAHIEAARRDDSDEKLAMPLGSEVSAPPLRQLEVCGQCHRRIEDVASSFPLKPENRSIVRFQPVGLGMSLCFQKGKSGLSCTSCHDPHGRVSRDHTHYEAVCLSCHGLVQNSHQVCPISPSTQCIDCHMPRRLVSADFLFTDHWIRKPQRDQNKAVAK